MIDFGAAATIVAERYRESGLIPSRESAILLYYGIISNSINLQASITKERDKEACKWLKSICNDISEEKIRDIFIKKSYIDESNLRFEMECEVANTFPEFSVTVAQLEIANIEDFLGQNKNKIIDIMKCIKTEKSVNYIFINCVDILNGYTIIFGVDEDSNKFITKTFDYQFNDDNIVKIDRIIQRKELTSLLRKKFNR